MSDRRRFIRTAGALALASLGAPAWAAAAWPSRPLRIIVPFPPGGTSDVIARLISKPLGDALGANVVVENKTGANGSIGAAAVAQATDEHTLLLSDMSALAITPLVTKEMPYKPSELKGVTLLAYSPHLLVAHPLVAASNIKELVALSQSKPMNVASSGSGSANHLGVVDIALATGLKWVHVPFRGGSQAIGDTAAGNTQLRWCVLHQVRSRARSCSRPRSPRSTGWRTACLAHTPRSRRSMRFASYGSPRRGRTPRCSPSSCP